MKDNVYGAISRCFLQKAAAKKLIKANQMLKASYPGLSLLVVDGTRPRRVQQRMWEIVKGTSMQRYVANPRLGSNHNYGCAVDITLIDDSTGNRLDMGSAMDHFGELSQPRLENEFLREGKLTKQAVKNRKILRDVMIAAGFNCLPIEWWHYDAFKTKEVRARYSIVE